MYYAAPVFGSPERNDRTAGCLDSLGEADVGADGVFVPALSRVVSRCVALVARRVLSQKKNSSGYIDTYIDGLLVGWIRSSGFDVMGVHSILIQWP